MHNWIAIDFVVVATSSAVVVRERIVRLLWLYRPDSKDVWAIASAAVVHFDLLSLSHLLLCFEQRRRLKLKLYRHGMNDEEGTRRDEWTEDDWTSAY